MKRNRAPTYAEKGKMWVEDSQPDADMDELLAVLGYKVKSSDMVDVAMKLEQLEMLMGSSNSGTTCEDESSHISDETVHYNPSDLSGWVQSMLVEHKNTNPTSTDIEFGNGSNNVFISFSNDQENQLGGNVFDDDLSAIPGKGVLRNGNLQNLEGGVRKNNKKIKSFPLGSDFIGNLQDFEDGVGKNNKKIRASPIRSDFNGNLQDLEDGVGKNDKKMKSFPIGSDFTGNLEPVGGRPVVLVDTQEAGIRLVHTMMACAEAVDQKDMKLAETLVKHIGVLAAPSQVGAMRKVATYFAEALARRIYKIYPHDLLQSSYNDLLENHFYESCPYLKFAHFTANQAILEAFSGAKRVHVIDFSLKQGMQWPALLQALALRPGGPPTFKLTGVGPPQPDNNDSLQQVGWKLAQLAESIGVEFEFKGFVANSLADLDASILEIRPGDVESVAVNSVFELHKLLGRASAIEKVLNSIKSMKPKIVTIVEQEGNHNGAVFLERFNEALHYYSTMFDSLEGGSELTQPNNEDLVMSEMYLGRQICNVVACEGVERVERHETLTQWRGRMSSAGFDPVHLGSNAFKQASMLLALFGGDGYRVEENGGCLMLGWHTRPLIATSTWRLGPSELE